MLNIGDYAQHQITGQIGQVIGYGHQMLNGVFLTTVTVRVTNPKEMGHSSFVEDVSSAWVLTEKAQTGTILYPHSHGNGAVAAA
jgi:hypothetical protein